MKKQMGLIGRKSKRNVLIVGLLTTALMAGALLNNGTVGLVSTVDAAAGTSGGGTTASALTKFKDIKGHWAQATIVKAYDKNLISGYQDGTFRPNAKITRGEYATLLSRATSWEKVQGENPFADLKGHWSESAVTQLVGQGFIDAGDYPKGFNPNAELTRYEMMKWIANGLIKSGTSFQDAFDDTRDTLLPTPEVNRGTIRAEQIPYLALVRGTGIVGGFEDGSLKPADPTTRAEVSAILLRYMDVEGTDAGKYSDLNEMREVGTTGTNLTTVSNYFYTKNSVTVSELSKGDIKLSNNSGVLTFHRFIVVKVQNGKPQGVYTKLFVEPQISSGNYYLTFADLSFISNTEKTDLITYSSGLNNGLLKFRRLDLDYATKNGFTTIPNSPKELITKGKKVRFWTRSSLDFKNGTYHITSENIGEMKIQNMYY
ncbi:S-layer homology domain-containing protein [Paenibacillus sp. UMB7766-LJ446]|uniref:S-layer homology domain-containing protein n=1 Tax=Paenibacillus sp. UMB7766-LJ446 TaxID=3046313 RepID=UPI00254C055C|nr:S-layer homology domain-containing protein [Paenibacillus sp. UMB7766-LJ446]MDK8189043.1 S-layer homology domain-containing protein [Paenibacillus sp. UMB7766-LJ446]